jgi:hypothetical protein
MREDGKKVPPTFKDEVASGVGGSEAKLQHVKHQEFDQLTPSDQSDGIGSTSVASKPRSTKRRARRIYRDPARPDDGARHPKWKSPNALKSGVYSGAPLIPGEDPREFDKLHSDLINEWKPVGPTLRFALRRLAVSMWQMNRIEKFTQTKLSLASFEPQSPTFNEVWGFTMFIGYLRSEPEESFEDHARKYLRPDRINYLREKFPRSNYQSASEWAKALTNEILLVSLPAIPGFEPPEPDATADFLKEAARQWKTDQRVAGCMVYMREVLEYDSEQTERLEARIIRQIRHCAELKAWEEAEEMRSKK